MYQAPGVAIVEEIAPGPGTSEELSHPIETNLEIRDVLEEDSTRRPLRYRIGLALLVLRGPRFETHDPGSEVHLRPLILTSKRRLRVSRTQANGFAPWVFACGEPVDAPWIAGAQWHATGSAKADPS